MKRIAAMVVTLMLMVGVVSTGCAADKISDVYLDTMKSLYDTYQKKPEAFNEEAIVIAYCEYQMYQMSLLLEMMQSSLGLPVSIFGDQLKPTVKTFRGLADIVGDEFNEWIDGKKSSEDFLTLIMGLYKVAIEGKKE